MNDQRNFIDLSDESIKDALALCRKIETRNPKNETSVRMAQGIAEYLNAHGFLSRKQAEWLVRNADYHKHSRPKELADIVVAPKGETTAQVSPASPTVRDDTFDPDDVRELLMSVRAELDHAIDRLRT